MNGNRIENKLSELKEQNKKAFITYVTAGLPDLEKTKAIIKAQEAAGTDIIELGIPFSDPIADGPVIQQASYEAILNGSTLRKIFVCLEELRQEGVNIPIVFMMYYNTVLHYGVEEFAKKCQETGVDGLIIPDLPFEEQDELASALKGSDKTIILQLVSPVSKERIPMILENARGFVYCVSSMGVTGQKDSFHKEIINYLKMVKENSKIPVMMGFGIKTAKDIEPMKNIIDGAIVGTHFINVLRESDFDEKVAAKYCTDFKNEMNNL